MPTLYIYNVSPLQTVTMRAVSSSPEDALMVDSATPVAALPFPRFARKLIVLREENRRDRLKGKRYGR